MFNCQKEIRVRHIMKEPLFYFKRMLRKLDNLIAISIVPLLTKIKKRPFKKCDKNALIFILENIGDTLRATPVINHFKDKDAIFVCSKYNREVIEMTGVREVIILNRDPGIFDAIKLLWKLRNSGFEYSLVLDYTQSGTFGVLISKMLKVRQIVSGFDSLPGDIHTNEIVYNNQSVDILTLSKASIAYPIVKFDKIEKRIHLENSAGFNKFTGCIGFHIGGFGSVQYSVSRQYPLEYAYTIIKSLIEKNKVIVTGEERDRKNFTGFSKELSINPNFVNLAGKLSLKELGYLLQNVLMYITPDNGTLHLAQAVGCKKIYALLGPSNPELVRGENTEIIRLNLWCSPCLNFLRFPERCKNENNHQCLRDLKPEIVLSKINFPN